MATKKNLIIIAATTVAAGIFILGFATLQSIANAEPVGDSVAPTELMEPTGTTEPSPTAIVEPTPMPTVTTVPQDPTPTHTTTTTTEEDPTVLKLPQHSEVPPLPPLPTVERSQGP